MRQALEHAEQPLSRFQMDYTELLHGGWFGIGGRWDVPKGACYVRNHDGRYVWVIPGREHDLSDFALVILDITTYQNPLRQAAVQPVPAIGKASTR
jgi:hypothetical protein